MNGDRPSVAEDVRGVPDYDDWRELLEAGILMGSQCGSCGQTTATPHRRCIECGSEHLNGTELPTTGEVYSETTINVTPTGFDEPYQIAIIDLDGTRLTARIAGTVEIADRVRFSDTITTNGCPAPVFEPIE